MNLSALTPADFNVMQHQAADAKDTRLADVLAQMEAAVTAGDVVAQVEADGLLFDLLVLERGVGL